MGFSNNWVFCLTLLPLPPSSFKGTSSETLFKLRCWKSDGSLGDVLAGWGEEARSKKATNRKMLVAIVQANFFSLASQRRQSCWWRPCQEGVWRRMWWQRRTAVRQWSRYWLQPGSVVGLTHTTVRVAPQLSRTCLSLALTTTNWTLLNDPTSLNNLPCWSGNIILDAWLKQIWADLRPKGGSLNKDLSLDQPLTGRYCWMIQQHLTISHVDDRKKLLDAIDWKKFEQIYAVLSSPRGRALNKALSFDLGWHNLRGVLTSWLDQEFGPQNTYVEIRATFAT